MRCMTRRAGFACPCYGELGDRIHTFAHGLEEMGYVPGQRLGVRLAGPHTRALLHFHLNCRPPAQLPALACGSVLDTTTVVPTRATLPTHTQVVPTQHLKGVKRKRAVVRGPGGRTTRRSCWWR